MWREEWKSLGRKRESKVKERQTQTEQMWVETSCSWTWTHLELSWNSRHNRLAHTIHAARTFATSRTFSLRSTAEFFHLQHFHWPLTSLLLALCPSHNDLNNFCKYTFHSSFSTAKIHFTTLQAAVHEWGTFTAHLLKNEFSPKRRRIKIPRTYASSLHKKRIQQLLKHLSYPFARSFSWFYTQGDAYNGKSRRVKQTAVLGKIGKS